MARGSSGRNECHVARRLALLTEPRQRFGSLRAGRERFQKRQPQGLPPLPGESSVTQFLCFFDPQFFGPQGQLAPLRAPPR
jgi:hypothetical protein